MAIIMSAAQRDVATKQEKGRGSGGGVADEQDGKQPKKDGSR